MCVRDLIYKEQQRTCVKSAFEQGAKPIYSLQRKLSPLGAFVAVISNLIFKR